MGSPAGLAPAGLDRGNRGFPPAILPSSSVFGFWVCWVGVRYGRRFLREELGGKSTRGIIVPSNSLERESEGGEIKEMVS